MAFTENSAPNANNYQLTGSRVYVRKSGDSFYRDLGNVVVASTTPNVETLEHRTSRSGKQKVDRVEEIFRSHTISMTLDEINTENLVLLFNASGQSAFTQTAQTAATQSIVMSSTIRQGGSVRLNHRRITGTPVVTDGAGSVTFTASTDYIIDVEAGIITILESGTIGQGDTLIVTYNALAIAGKSLPPNSAAGIQKLDGFIFLRISSDGEVDEWAEERTDAATIAPTGSLASDTTAWNTFDMDMVILSDTTDATSPDGVIRRF